MGTGPVELTFHYDHVCINFNPSSKIHDNQLDTPLILRGINKNYLKISRLHGEFPRK